MPGRRHPPDIYAAATQAARVTGGTYTLLIEVPTDVTCTIGALGDHHFSTGWYAYTGSAFGPGGFARVERHCDIAAGLRTGGHWHIDHLLASPSVSIHGDVRTPDAAIECAVATQVHDGPVAGFGASDCHCRSHLATHPRCPTLLQAISDAHHTQPDTSTPEH